MITLIRGNIINPLNRLKTEIINDGALLYENGKIIDYLKHDDAVKKYNNFEEIDYSDKYISPGFIDIHLHCPQVNQRARYGESLMQWLEKYIFQAEENFQHLDIAEEEIKNCINLLIKNGTTTSCMYSSHHKKATDLIFQLANKSGIKSFIGKVMMDFNIRGKSVESTEQSLTESYDLYKKWDGFDNNRLNYIFTPRFAPVCTENLLKELGNLSKKENIYIQSHLAENKEEIEQVLDIFFGYKNYTELYYKTGILSPKTIMAHCIHLSEEEFDYLYDTNTKIAHCPSSNFFLKSGRFKFKYAERKGLQFGLGSDVGAGPSFSMFDVMKSMNYMHTFHILPQKSYYYATLGNAKVLGIEDSCGNFEIGKDADFVIIDIHQYYNNFSYQCIEDLLAYLIYLGNPGFIVDSFVRGKKLIPF